MKRLSIFFVVASVSLAVAGCSTIQSFLPKQVPQRDSESGQVTQGNDNADVFSLKVGDCTNTADISEDEVNSVPVVPCAEPHDDEAYLSRLIDGDAYPGDDAIKAQSEEVCGAEFSSFIGVAYDDSKLDYWSFYPTEGSWGNGDREVLCMVYDPDGKVSGTLKGAAR